MFKCQCKFFLASLFLLASSASAQDLFSDEIIILDSGVYDLLTLFPADLDGDGDLDILLSGEQGPSSLVWHENLDGQGNFGFELPITGRYDWSLAVYVADMDSDGDMDIISANFNQSGVVWYPNIDGQGTFGEGQFICTFFQDSWFGARFIHPLSAADLDGDNDKDVLLASRDSLFWCGNLDGQGTFGDRQFITNSVKSPESISAADLDGDADLDILSAYFDDNKIAWYENLDGSGAFGPQQVVTVDAMGAHAAYAADVDSDGDLDILSESHNDNTVAWYENRDGQGSFGEQLVISDSVQGLVDIHFGDLDTDGDLDVISVASDLDELAWYENTDGLGGFGAPQTIITRGIGLLSAFAGDIDLDGDLDLVSMSHTDSNVSWYENIDGRADFGKAQQIAASLGGLFNVSAADLDGDGDADLMSASYYDGKIAWYENTDGLASFGDQIVIDLMEPGPFQVEAADIDDDGDLDVLASFDNGSIFCYPNTDGKGTFDTSKIVAETVGSGWFEVADLDGDGDLDVLSGSSEGSAIAWHENSNGHGNFMTRQIPSGRNAGTISISASDLDGDGDLDVLSSSTEDHIVAWYENLDGRGSFGEQQVLTPPVPANSVDDVTAFDVADLDNDGDLDVVATSWMKKRITWYRNLNVVSNIEASDGTLQDFVVSQNFPNPFNPETTIRYRLPEAAKVKLQIYNLLGQKVVTLIDARQRANSYKVTWNGRDAAGKQLPSGIYIYRLQAGEFVASKRMLLLR